MGWNLYRRRRRLIWILLHFFLSPGPFVSLYLLVAFRPALRELSSRPLHLTRPDLIGYQTEPKSFQLFSSPPISNSSGLFSLRFIFVTPCSTFLPTPSLPLRHRRFAPCLANTYLDSTQLVFLYCPSILSVTSSTIRS